MTKDGKVIYVQADEIVQGPSLSVNFAAGQIVAVHSNFDVTPEVIDFIFPRWMRDAAGKD